MIPASPVASVSRLAAHSLAHGQNFGDMTRTVATSDLVINAADHPPRMVVPAHEHANTYLCVVVACGKPGRL